MFSILSQPTQLLQVTSFQGSQDRMNSGNLVRPPPPTSFMSRASAVTSQVNLGNPGSGCSVMAMAAMAVLKYPAVRVVKC